MATLDPFTDCSVPPVLFGTGTLYVVEDGDEVSAGNFSSVDLVQEGSVERYFSGSDEMPSPLGITAGWRLILTGDTFSLRNLSRLLNIERQDGDTGAHRFELVTVRTLAIRGIRFERDVSPRDCDESPCLLSIHFWRAYFDLPQTWTFSQDEPTIYVFNLIALPDPIAHPDNPFGRIETCALTVAG